MTIVAERRIGSHRRRYAALLPFAVLAPIMPIAAQTRPGTVITNVARLAQDGAAITSNGIALTVAERLDVALDRAPAADAVLADGTAVVGVTLTNRGSGDEAFVVAATLASGSATLGIPRVGDAPLVDGRTGSLPPGAAVTLLLPVSGASADAALTVGVRAATGSGTPGTTFAGAGDAGSDAVVGPTGAAAQLTVPLAAAAPPTFEKSQLVSAPDGTATPVAGATIVYTLVARFTAPVSAADMIDTIPAGTSYRPGTLTLDGVPLADAGHIAAGQIAVPLGAVAAGTVRILRFTVVIS